MDLEHELDQGVLQPRALAFEELEAAAGDLRAALEVKYVELLAEVVVWDHRVGQVAQVVESLAVALDVVGLPAADRGGVVGDIRQFEQ